MRRCDSLPSARSPRELAARLTISLGLEITKFTFTSVLISFPPHSWEPDLSVSLPDSVPTSNPTPGGLAASTGGPGRPTRRLVPALLLAALVGTVGLGVWIWQPWVPDTHLGVEQAIKKRQFSLAEAGAEKLTRTDPRDTRAWLLLARARTATKDMAGAVEALRKIPDFSLHKPDALYFEAKSLLEMHRGRDAEQAFRKCVAKSAAGSGIQVNAQIELLAIFAMEERWEEFKEMFWQLYPQMSGQETVTALTMRMRSEFEQTKPELSIEFLSQFVAADPSDANALAGLAAAQDQLGNLSEALKLYQQASELDPKNLDLRDRYLGALLRHGDMETLKTEVEALPQAAHERAAIMKIRAIMAQNAGAFDDAASLLDKYLQIRPDDSEAVHRIGQVLLRLGRKDEAAKWTEARNELNAGRDKLREAWNDFADRYESDPNNVSADLLRQLGKACKQARMDREGNAWLKVASEFAAQGLAP